MSKINELTPYQQSMIDAWQYKGRGLVQMTGRQHGKSQWSSQAMKRLIEDLWFSPVQDLVLSEGRVYGSRYYCIEPVGGNWREMEAWCMDTFGGPGDCMWGESKAPYPAQRWYMNNRKFWFRSERDRDWFILRWRS